MDIPSNTTYYCRECNTRLALSGKVISAHYQKAHFSTWVANRDIIERFPKAFVITDRPQSKSVVHSSQSSSAASQPKADPTADKNRAANALKYAGILEDVHSNDVQTYRGDEYYLCPCCKRTLTTGKRILFIDPQKRFTICNQCYAAARKIIMTKKKQIKLEYHPFGGMPKRFRQR